MLVDEIAFLRTEIATTNVGRGASNAKTRLRQGLMFGVIQNASRKRHVTNGWSYEPVRQSVVRKENGRVGLPDLAAPEPAGRRNRSKVGLIQRNVTIRHRHPDRSRTAPRAPPRPTGASTSQICIHKRTPLPEEQEQRKARAQHERSPLRCSTETICATTPCNHRRADDAIMLACEHRQHQRTSDRQRARQRRLLPADRTTSRMYPVWRGTPHPDVPPGR
jgi:hypothetical protein